MLKFRIGLLLCLLFLCTHISAATVDSATAKIVAQNFYMSKFGKGLSQPSTITLSTSWKSVQHATSDTIVCFYIFNIDNGFVIVSGDDKIYPILAFSDETSFNSTALPENLTFLMKEYAREILAVIENPYTDNSETKSLWSKYIHSESTLSQKSALLIGPLIKTKWAQTNYYNNLCPVDANGPGGHAFICDGFDEPYFHVNWGWGGSHNGYFTLSAMNPGPYSFNSEQAAIIGIRGPHLPGVSVAEHPNEPSLSVYPNPSNGQFSIQLSSDNLLPQSNFFIYDIYGRLLKSGRVESDRYSINLKDLSAGTYILQVGTSTGKISKKIIIQ